MQEPFSPVTGPDPGVYERGTGAPPRSTGIQGAVGAVLIALALGLAIRLILLYLLPGSGFAVDLASFRFWADDLAKNGLSGFYERDFFHDYTPGYLYVLWVVGTIGRAAGDIGDLIKVPPILADLGIAYLVWSMIRELGGRDRLALLGAVVVMVNPILWFDSVVWGQVDSVGVLFLMLGLRALWHDRPERAAIFAVIAAIVKPQLGILIPIVAVVTIRRALRPVPHDPDGAASASRWRQLEAQTGHPLRIVTTGIAGYLTALVLCLPFGLSVIELSPAAPFFASGLLDQIALAGGGYPYLTVNAYNAWAIVPGDLGVSLAAGGQWVCDAANLPADRCGAGIAQFGGVPAVAIGAALLVVVILTVLCGRVAPPGPPHDHRRTGRHRPGLLRSPDPRPRALRVPVLRAGGDPLRGVVAVADRLRDPDRRDVRQHVRRPHDDLSARRPVRPARSATGLRWVH